MNNEHPKYAWIHTFAKDGTIIWTCKLDDEHELLVQQEPNDLFSWGVVLLKEDDAVPLTRYDYETDQEARHQAERGWRYALTKPPEPSETQNFDWKVADFGDVFECRMGMWERVILQAWRDDITGLWSSYASYQHDSNSALLYQELDAFKTHQEAKDDLQEWYLANSLKFLDIPITQHSAGRRRRSRKKKAGT